MHGTRVFLPNKLGFFKQMSLQLQADVIAIAYRGFSLSDGSRPSTKGIKDDITAMADYYNQILLEKGGPSTV